MRRFIVLLLAPFVVLFAACGETPVESPLGSSGLTPAGPPSHANNPGGPVVVDANSEAGWIFNRDASNATPAGFSFGAAQIGSGSLHAEPITNGPPNGNASKFILEYFPDAGIAIGDFGGFSIDFLIDPDGTSFPANQFYINVYTSMNPPNGGFYDCRFDYVATSGSTTDWTTLAVGGAPTNIVSRHGTLCPATLADMPASATISLFAVNLGDTGANDGGVGGYFDNAVLTVEGSTTTYDFEPNCKSGGWESLTRPDGSGFKNQGRCMKYAKTGK